MVKAVRARSNPLNVIANTLMVLMFLFLLIRIAPQPPQTAYAQQYGEEWVGRYTLDDAYSNLTHAIHTVTFHIGPQVFWDGINWQELHFENKYVSDGYYLIENSHVSAYVYEWYTVFYDPDNQRVCVDDERWIVEVWSDKTGKWREVDLYNPSLTYSNNATHLTVTRTFDCPEGLFTVTYIVWQGSFLKHDIVFESKMDSNQQFRVTMKLSGIYHNKVSHSEGVDTITSEKHVVSPYFFVGEDNSNLVLSEYLWSLGTVNETTGEWVATTLKDIVFDVHAKGCKADIIIGNYTLAQAESLQIDPDTSTWQVGASSDDCRRYWTGSSWSFYTNVNSVMAGHYKAYKYKYGSGMRFTGVGLAQGINIDSAYLKFCSALDRTKPDVNTKIKGEASDNATTFSTNTDFVGRTRTSSMVYWDNIEAWTEGYWYTSPDIKTIVQEIIDRAGWSSGNNLVVFWQDFDDRSAHWILGAYRCGHSYDGSPGLAPKLEVTYTNPLPKIAEFDAPSVVKQNTYFNLNCNIKDGNGIEDFVNATVQISHEIILKWDNITNTFTEFLDTNNYCDLWSSASTRTTVNSTAYRLSWKIRLNENYPEGSVDVIATNTKVYDSENNTGTNSYTGLFTFEVEVGDPGSTPPSEPPPEDEGAAGGAPYYPPAPTIPFEPPTPIPKEIAPWPLQYGSFILIGLVLVAGAYRLKPKSTRQLFMLKTSRKPRKRKKQPERAKPKTKLYHKKVVRKPRKPSLWKRLTRR